MLTLSRGHHPFRTRRGLLLAGLVAACNSGSVVAPPPPREFRNLGGLDSHPEFVR